MKLTDNELKQIIGGGFTATMLGNIIKAVNSILDLGRSFGSAIRRLQNGRLCSF